MAWQTFAHEADVGVRGSGATLAEAFAGAAQALTATICEPAAVMARQAITIDCAAPDAELLLVDWLNALVYEMATRHMLFARFDVAIEETPASARATQDTNTNRLPFHLRATAWGEPVDAPRHQPAAEVKGASYCELKVAREPDGLWVAQCVVDI